MATWNIRKKSLQHFFNKHYKGKQLTKGKIQELLRTALFKSCGDSTKNEDTLMLSLGSKETVPTGPQRAHQRTPPQRISSGAAPSCPWGMGELGRGRPGHSGHDWVLMSVLPTHVLTSFGICVKYRHDQFPDLGSEVLGSKCPLDKISPHVGPGGPAGCVGWLRRGGASARALDTVTHNEETLLTWLAWLCQVHRDFSLYFSSHSAITGGKKLSK